MNGPFFWAKFWKPMWSRKASIRYLGVLGVASMLWLPASGAWRSFYLDDEHQRYEIWQWLAKHVAFTSFMTCALAAGLSVVYFLDARKRIRALEEMSAADGSLLEIHAKHFFQQRLVRRMIVGWGFIGIMLALSAVIVLAANLWLAFGASLQTVTGREQARTMIFICKKLCLGSGLCSGIFWIATEWVARRTATIQQS